jgi:hypothetical protein
MNRDMSSFKGQKKSGFMRVNINLSLFGFLWDLFLAPIAVQFVEFKRLTDRIIDL